MLSRLTHHFPHYFNCRLQRRLEELYATVGIQDFALGMMILFEPVYLFQLGHKITQIAWFYALVYGVYIVLIPLGGKVVARFGPPRTIAASTMFMVLYYVSLISLATLPWLYWVAPIIFAIQKTLYWPGYHADFIATSDQGERGKEYSALYSVTTLMYIIGPAIGGIIIKLFGFPVLFTLGAMLIFISTLPLLADRTKFTPQPFSYWDCFTLPFKQMHRRTTLAYIGFGEELLSTYIWPIFLLTAFVTVTKMGGYAAGAALLTALITLIIGRMFDRGHWHHLFRRGAYLSAINWLARLFIHHIPWVFTSDTLGRIAGNTTLVTATDVTYERSIKENEPIRRAILLEQGLSYGKCLIAVLLALLGTIWSPFTVTFILGAVFSLFYLAFK